LTIFHIKISYSFVVIYFISLYLSNISLKTKQMGLKVTIELTDQQEAEIAKKHLLRVNLPTTFSIAKSARLIGISESTIHRRIKDGLITVNKMGKSHRITAEEIERYKNING